MANKQITAAPSDTSTKQYIENFQNCNTITVSGDVNNQCKKNDFSPEAQQQEQEKTNKAKFDHQLKEIR